MAASTLLRAPNCPGPDLRAAATGTGARSPEREQEEAPVLHWSPPGGSPPSGAPPAAARRPCPELARLLPARAYPYPPDHARSAARPPGTDCAFYRSGGDLLGPVDLYRLCWAADTLVAKDTVPAGRARH
ncbi:hypothetical protein [Streptomyces erythrochromogenes]|uniref:hypothetical protein n=1 Tax=Streptomyces erythrochromogenes TaxID=285574 RepID=UPI002252F060|nr:hypothetical protein [Streptomyces erythrochromogenes]MCX5588647.1 hypothetical protein [Streptomyces erythrochromogenes]